MTHVQHLKPFLRKTPFFEPIDRLMHGNGWIRWMGYYSPAFFDSEQSEYFATRHGASVYDVSPLIKYAIRGKDAARFANYLVTRDLTKVKPMQAAYTAWCDDDGKMIEEGTIFRLGENDFILNAALHQLHWLDESAYGFDVEIEEISDQLAGLSLQGPTSREILQQMGVQGIEKLPHFGIMETTVDGHWLRIDRAGFTGDLGYELWVKPQDGIWLWETLFRIGDPYKIAPMGSQALDWLRIEAGFILVDADYTGSHHALRPTSRVSPFEAGIGWCVGLKKDAYFVGKRALRAEKEKGLSRHILIGIEVEGRKPAPGSFLYADRAGKQEIGITTSAMWSPGLKKNIAFAKVPPSFVKPGTQMWIEIWYPKEHKIERSMVKCWAANRMFYDPPRKKA
ncbi:MAG: aminomethyl transferase family protein [Rhodospirillaceae bacterium]|nr:MAG: aminomethyl transferase family protein [Rhodospirillaceae bacterium]